MACTHLSGGIQNTCENNQGGIKKLYIAELESIDSIVHGSPVDDIDSITMVSGKKFYEFEFHRNTSNFTEVTSNAIETGTTVVTQTLTLVLNYREQTKRDTLILLGRFKELCAIVLDSNGKYTVLGETNGLILTENNSQTGTTKTDRNGYTLTFVAEEPEEARETTAAVVATVIA